MSHMEEWAEKAWLSFQRVGVSGETETGNSHGNSPILLSPSSMQRRGEAELPFL